MPVATVSNGVREIAPGILHWSAPHEVIGIDVHSYYLPEERVALDPMTPPGGVDALGSVGGPTTVLLTNRHHWRHSAEIVERFGASVHVSRPGLHEFGPDSPVEAFDFGDELPGGVVAHEVAAICPDETALHIPARNALAVADGVVRFPEDGPLGFVPDTLMDDPEAVKAKLIEAYTRLLDLDFEHLLLAHGAPIAGEGKDALRRFLDAPGTVELPD